ncbi:MAG TPA: hypothetical protein VME47_11565 [Acetobacteraceae bacterium]|nr:hypothetical protein [Acetobacteraceae bacterium]
MPTPRATPTLPPTRRRPSAHPKPAGKLAAAQAIAALHTLQASGVLTGHADKVSARLDHGLLQAAARKIGSNNTTEVMQAALAAFVAPDPFVEWLLSDRDRLPADFELAI